MPPPPRRQIARPRLATELVAWLETSIESGDLAPGDQLPTAAALGERFGVSRSVVREAVARLSAAGRLDARQGAGIFVKAPSADRSFRLAPPDSAALEAATELLELRIAVETEMAGLAAQRRNDIDIVALLGASQAFTAAVSAGEDALSQDRALHIAIAQAAHNDYFVRFVGLFGDRLIPPRMALSEIRSAQAHAVHLKIIDMEHRGIVDAIVAGNAAKARKVARLHLYHSLTRLRMTEAIDGREKEESGMGG